MHLEVSATTEARIRKLVAGGAFSSTDEVVANALELLEEHEAYWAAVSDRVDAGIADLDRGNSRELSSGLLKDIERRGIERLVARKSD